MLKKNNWIILGIFLMSLEASATATAINKQIMEAYSVDEVQTILSKLGKGASIFCDVDDTLITPASKLFRAKSPYRTLIDELKKNKDQYPNFEQLLSHWRLARKTMLVSDQWPDLITSLKQQYPVYALTKMDSGTIGDIKSMEEWRYNELMEKGISFTPSYNGVTEDILVHAETSQSSSATFYKGIFITGSFNKSKVIDAYLKTQSPTQIAVVDDRQEVLEELNEECNRHSIPFLGILFKGAELIPGQPDPEVAVLQKETFFKEGQWLEDEEAEKRMKKLNL